MKPNLIVLSLIVLSMAAAKAQAQQLYKWVDDQGVTHYSESLPSQHVDHVAFEFTEDYQVPNTQDDYYSIQNQLKRLQERRSQRRAEKQQAAKVKESARQAPEVIYVQASEPERRYFAPAYFPKHYLHRYNNHYAKRYPTPKHQKQLIDKPRSGIAHKAKASKSGAAFSAAR